MTEAQFWVYYPFKGKIDSVYATGHWSYCAWIFRWKSQSNKLL